MKIIRTAVIAMVFCPMFFISCQETKNNVEQTEESEKITTEVKAEEVLPEVKAEAVLNDTIGIYKLSNPEAQAYIVEMNKLIFEIEKAMDNNTPDKMPTLMREIQENQKKQLKIQAELSESDRILFGSYMDNIGKKLIAQGDRMSNM